MKYSIVLQIDFEAPDTVSENEIHDAAIDACADAEMTVNDIFRGSAPDAWIVSIRKGDA